MQRLTSLSPYQSEEYRLRKHYIETFRILDYFSHTFSLMLYILLLLLCPVSQVLFLFTFFVPVISDIYCQKRCVEINSNKKWMINLDLGSYKTET